jgi:SAM-dependent MidA family methyltransferase
MDDSAGNPALIDAIRAEIAAAGGAIPFARFMTLALTHPVHGYYASGRGAPGRAGADFLTAPETSPYFGRCLAVQIAECWHRLGAPAAFTIWESGAGAGTLALTVLDALAAQDPAAYAAMHYWLDDASPAALDRARTLLAAHGAHIAFGAPPIGFVGLLLANEFVDALPVHRVRVSGGEFQEEYVAWDSTSGALVSHWIPASMEKFSMCLRRSGISFAEGQIAEVSLAAVEWIRGVAARMGQGYTIIIDYGDTAERLYRAGRFPEGSLMCYYRHTTNREPLRRVGEQDMTAHVDFTALAGAGDAAGLASLGLTTQAAFLSSLGLGEMLYAATQTATDAFAYMQARDAVVRLIEPSAMGRNRVLLQGKAVPTDPPLMGLAEPPIW